MNLNSLLKDFFGEKIISDMTRGEKVCSVCRTKMVCRLEDVIDMIEWEYHYQDKYQIQDYQLCNHCLYHLLLFSIFFDNEEIIINQQNFVLAYSLSMQYERNGFFDPIDLSCKTIVIGETFSDLEKRDETQGHYCVVFNNSYDILMHGTVKWYLSKNHWHKVYLYQKTRFYTFFNTPRHGDTHE